LFSDHRETRARIGAEARGRSFHNLFAYTGTFTCAAALGGAASTTSVDASRVYLDWASENLKANGLPPGELAAEEVREFVSHSGGRRWDLCLLDPPSWSDRG